MRNMEKKCSQVEIYIERRNFALACRFIANNKAQDREKMRIQKYL